MDTVNVILVLGVLAGVIAGAVYAVRRLRSRPGGAPWMRPAGDVGVAVVDPWRLIGWIVLGLIVLWLAWVAVATLLLLVGSVTWNA